MQQWKGSGSATMVGSMPHTDRDKVIELVFRHFPEVPVWPQLSAYSDEQMMNQYLEGLPGVVNQDGRIFVDTAAPGFEDELYRFYEEYLELESSDRSLVGSRFGMGDQTGRTFFQFIDELSRHSTSASAVKGQIVGPFTFLSGMKDREGRALLYDERMQDAAAKLLAMKARWQVEHLKAAGRPVIIFLDEPALAGFGSSAFVTISREMILQLLKEVVDAVHNSGAAAGIHVCANTDWLLTFQSGVEIINLDAYTYFDKFALYKEAFTDFMKNGGCVAWGMVPTNDPALLEKETAQGLAKRWLAQIDSLTSKSLSTGDILSQSLFTPSCGCGSLSEKSAEKVLRMTSEVGQLLRAQLLDLNTHGSPQ
jgi:methionine synthase II (cobalamin-independent)